MKSEDQKTILRDSPSARLAVPNTKPLADTLWGRTLYYQGRRTRSRISARIPRVRKTYAHDPIFIIGCGRSGTTLLGNIFKLHPDISYLYEPYDIWAAIEPLTDVWQLYSRGECHCLLGADDVTRVAYRRYRRLMATQRHQILVEKNPINTLRIGYINALAPNARFVHIARDGVDVVRSIERLSAITLKIGFRLHLNSWWGIENSKWCALRNDGFAASYYPSELHELKTSAQRGAYEWLVSQREVEMWRPKLGSRLLELRFQDLTKDPEHELRELTANLSLSCPQSWLGKASSMVESRTHGESDPVALPDQMRGDFNRIQERFDFNGRAIGLTGSAPRSMSGAAEPPANQ